MTRTFLSDAAMRELSNETVRTLLRHLPRVLGAVESGVADLRVYNSARILGLLLKRLRRAEDRRRGAS